MHPILQHKYVRIGLYILGTILILFTVLVFTLTSLNSARETGSMSMNSIGYAPSMDGYAEDMVEEREMVNSQKMLASDYYPAPTPSPTGYTIDLETYETTQYDITGSSKDFNSFCTALANLKGSNDIHFKSLQTATNYCRATLYVEKSEAESVLATLTNFKNIEAVRDTESVTRHKQQLESQTAILQQQLARIESSLTAAEMQLARLNTFFSTSNEVTELSAEVTNSLRYIDQLTQKKITYLSQLNNVYQQSADLTARMNVVEFNVRVTRAQLLNPGQYERAWSVAWNELKSTANETLIGLSTVLGIFLLWAIRITIYLLVVIIAVRALWKFIKLLWQK